MMQVRCPRVSATYVHRIVESTKLASITNVASIKDKGHVLTYVDGVAGWIMLKIEKCHDRGSHSVGALGETYIGRSGELMIA